MSRVSDIVNNVVSPVNSLGIPRVSAVIPTWNEAENLRVLVPLLPDWIDELVIVDGYPRITP